MVVQDTREEAAGTGHPAKTASWEGQSDRTTLSQRAVAAAAAEIEIIHQQRAAAEERREFERRIERRAMAERAIAANATWLPSDADCDADMDIVYADGLTFYVAGSAADPALVLAQRCSHCDALLPMERTFRRVESLAELGHHLQSQRDYAICEDCYFIDDAATELDIEDCDSDVSRDESDDEPLSATAVRDGWLYLPHDERWINPAHITFIHGGATANDGPIDVYVIATARGAIDVEHPNDVAAVTAWLWGRS